MKGTVLMIMMMCIAATAHAQTDSVKNFVAVKKEKINLMKPIPANQYAKGLGFFCRQELKVEKKLQIPVLFRLGSTDYCNYMEQKPGYGLPK